MGFVILMMRGRLGVLASGLIHYTEDVGNLREGERGRKVINVLLLGLCLLFPFLVCFAVRLFLFAFPVLCVFLNNFELWFFCVYSFFFPFSRCVVTSVVEAW